MKELKFIQLQKDNDEHCKLFENLMIPYMKELDEHKNRVTPEDFVFKFTHSILKMQGPYDRHLELCYDNEKLIGFLYGKVDREGHKGFIKPGFGYIMEFFILPKYRLQGYGKAMFQRIESLFATDGAKQMYLNTDPITGVPFWTAMGFTATDEVSPENNMVIYEKEVSILNVVPMKIEHIEFVYQIKSCVCNKAALHGGDMTLDEWKQACLKNLADPDETNFIIQKGIIPVAWLKVNSLKSSWAWISMLVVHEKFHRQGIGSFAVQYAEDFVRSKGINIIGIHTTVDNIAAKNCYKKLGYHIHDEAECITGDGVKRLGLSFHRDHLDAVRMNIDGVTFYIGEPHDFSFISKIGKVFCVFDAMDSGNICFVVERDGKRYFVKYAGVRTQEYEGKIEDAVIRLKNAVKVYENLNHPYLIHLVDHYTVGNGYIAVFDWVDGEGLRSYWNFVGEPMWKSEASPNYRFRHLPTQKRIAVVDKIMEFHKHIVDKGYVPVDFYGGSMIYDFDTDDFHICDIDFYRKTPAKNDMGKMWGSSRFMSPEEYELGADLDEKTVVYLLGATAFELLANDTEESYQAWEDGKLSRSFGTWSATKALFDVALKAVSKDRSERYKTVSELITAWNAAKVINN
ncbi:MAG: GNAT family N-acetyltransferase [Eubacteriales bacterium]|nr:GNAT family N-acetyltransferase [Eubacteriales bacterium]